MLIKNLDDFVFGYNDYWVFEKENLTSISPEVMNQRKIIKEKLLEINNVLKPEMIKRNLYNHWEPSHIVSWLTPNEYNSGVVNWIGIRYGRSKPEIINMNQGLSQDEKREKVNFPKYACMQINVTDSGINIGIFHAVPFGSFDRKCLHSMIDERAPEIIEKINELHGFGLSWNIDSATTNETYSFPFDYSIKDKFILGNEEPKDFDARKFIDFYKKYDKDGFYSHCLYHIPKKDPRLKTVDSICETALDYFDLLLDFYNVLIWRPKF